jgi:formylglycine-generating enzyme required for sulfatase activity
VKRLTIISHLCWTALLFGLLVCSFATSAPWAQAAKASTPAKKPAAKPASKPAAQAPAPKPISILVPGTTVKLDFVGVPGGSISIKDSKGQLRQVTIKPFLIAKTETPWEAFDPFLSSGPPSKAYDQSEIPPDAVARPSTTYIPPDMGWGHAGYPVICESALTAEMYCRWLSQVTGRKLRLPTEAEWEYACRAGAANAKPLSAEQLDKVAWYIGNSGEKTHPVGKKQPNAWGLYDMLGNAGEWAIDLDGKPVLCGGTFQDKAEAISPSTRAYQTPDWQATDPQFPKSRWWLADGWFVGFRMVCEP